MFQRRIFCTARRVSRRHRTERCLFEPPQAHLDYWGLWFVRSFQASFCYRPTKQFQSEQRHRLLVSRGSSRMSNNRDYPKHKVENLTFAIRSSGRWCGCCGLALPIFRFTEQFLGKLWGDVKVPLSGAECDSHSPAESQESLRL